MNEVSSLLSHIFGSRRLVLSTSIRSSFPEFWTRIFANPTWRCWGLNQRLSAWTFSMCSTTKLWSHFLHFHLIVLTNLQIKPVVLSCIIILHSRTGVGGSIRPFLFPVLPTAVVVWNVRISFCSWGWDGVDSDLFYTPIKGQWATKITLNETGAVLSIKIQTAGREMAVKHTCCPKGVCYMHSLLNLSFENRKPFGINHACAWGVKSDWDKQLKTSAPMNLTC